MAIRVWKHAAGAAPALVSVTLHAAVLGVTALIAWPVEPSEVVGGDSIVVGETVAVASLAPFEVSPSAPKPEQHAAPLDDAPVAAPAPGAFFDELSIIDTADPVIAPPDRTWSEGRRREAASADDLLASGSEARQPAPVSFAGAGVKRATRVVFVVDGSGPMVTSLPMVLAEVRRSVARMSDAQRFTVVVFRGGGPERFTSEPVRTTASARARLDAWLGAQKAAGRSDPLEGLRAALAMQPDVVFLLSRSIPRSAGAAWAGGRTAVLNELETLNPMDPETGRRPTAIRTIQFLEPDPSGVMPAIAAAHGGPSPGAASVLTLDALRSLEAAPQGADTLLDGVLR